MTSTPVAGTAGIFTVGDEIVTLPVEVRSARMVAAQYLVDADAAQRLIDYSGLEIARQLGGRAICVLSAVDYNDNDLGPYHEIAVTFVVRPHDAPPGWKPSMREVTTFIHRLPVNQAFTCEVGRGLWGFPKWVSSISYRQRRGHTTAILVDGGELVLRLEIGRGWMPLPDQVTDMTCYSFDRDAGEDGKGLLRRTPWTTRNRLVRARPGGARLELGGAHPMADELRSLGLPKTALAAMTTGLMGATFGAPEVVTP